MLFDTTHMFMSVTPNKSKEIKYLVKNWLKKQKATRKILESLIISIIGKILDWVILIKERHVLKSSNLQFGFKNKQVRKRY